MSLIYRGQAAQPSATAKTVKTGITAQFLGRPFTIRKTQESAQRKQSHLQFRGVMY